MTYIDFHTHHPSLEGEEVIVDGTDTSGIHPWQASGESTLTTTPHTMAIGECGLDRCCTTPYDIQLADFERCIRESEVKALPLVLHCVKAIDDCLALRRTLGAVQPWIWHGYRGKAVQLRQLIDKGFWFSFGTHYNVDALRACPLNRMLLETDDQRIPVRIVYERACADLRMPVCQLAEAMQTNYHTLFGNLW